MGFPYVQNASVPAVINGYTEGFSIQKCFLFVMKNNFFAHYQVLVLASYITSPQMTSIYISGSISVSYYFSQQVTTKNVFVNIFYSLL